MKKSRFSILEMMVVISIILILMAIVMPILNVVRNNANKTKTMAAAKSIGLIMVAYAEDDLKNFKMPYPVPRGEEVNWGTDKKCWSPAVAQMLFAQKYMRKGDESQLKSNSASAANYQPMYLDDNTIDLNRFWEERTSLDFQMFCDKNLTSNVSGKVVLVATYDNEDIRDCQFEGAGWVVFFADKTTEFLKRARIREYEPDATTPVISVNATEGDFTVPNSVASPKVLGDDLRKKMADHAPFGTGGGSTELMGIKDTSPVYKALVR